MLSMCAQGIDGEIQYPTKQSQTGYLCKLCRSEMRPLICVLLFYAFLVNQHPKIISHPNLLVVAVVVNVLDIPRSCLDGC